MQEEKKEVSEENLRLYALVLYSYVSTLQRKVDRIEKEVKNNYKFFIFESFVLFFLHILNFVEIVRLRG